MTIFILGVESFISLKYLLNSEKTPLEYYILKDVCTRIKRSENLFFKLNVLRRERKGRIRRRDKIKSKAGTRRKRAKTIGWGDSKRLGMEMRI
jgi:hypothetical protein